MNIKPLPTPYPNIGELLRLVAAVLETKPQDKKFDVLSQQGHFDYKLVNEYLDEIFTLPPSMNCGQAKSVLSARRYDLLPWYTRNIIQYPFTVFRREQTKYFLIENLTGESVAINLLELLPDKENLLAELTSADDPVVFAFDWLKSKYGEQYAEFRSNLRKNDQDKTLRWQNGVNNSNGQKAPNLALFDILDRFSKFANLDQSKTEELNLIFYVAKIVQNVCEKTEGYKTKTVIHNWIAKKHRQTHPFKYISQKMDHSYELYSTAIEPFFRKFEQIVQSRYSHNMPIYASKKDYLDDLNEMIQLAEKNANENPLWWHQHRFEALKELLSGNWKKALSLYEKALNGFFYTGDLYLKLYFYEFRSLAALYNKRPLVKKIKQYGIAFGLAETPFIEKGDEREDYSTATSAKGSDHIVEDWEVKNWASEFPKIFPEANLFQDFDKKKFPTKEGIVIVGSEGWQRQPDLKHLGKRFKTKNPNKTYPQLVWFAEQNDIDALSQLIEAGAIDNTLSSSGELAILFAIQSMNPSTIPRRNDGRAFELFRDMTYPPRLANSITHKKKLSPLGCAVETGRPEVVERVIELGAGVDIKYSRQNMTPLYSAIQCLVQTKRSSYLEVIEILLRHGASPNTGHRINGHEGFTPLMLAAESDLVNAFSKMIEYDGNPNQRTKASPISTGQLKKFDCWDIAVEWSSDNVIQYLEENQ